MPKDTSNNTSGAEKQLGRQTTEEHILEIEAEVRRTKALAELEALKKDLELARTGGKSGVSGGVVERGAGLTLLVFALLDGSGLLDLPYPNEDLNVLFILGVALVAGLQGAFSKLIQQVLAGSRKE